MTTRLRNIMIYPIRLLNIFSRFLFTEGSNLPYPIILREWLLTQRSALPCIRVIITGQNSTKCDISTVRAVDLECWSWSRAASRPFLGGLGLETWGHGLGTLIINIRFCKMWNRVKNNCESSVS